MPRFASRMLGATLTISPGVTVYALKDDGSGKAPALVVEAGAKLVADGNSASPITFTSALPSQFLPQAGAWNRQNGIS